MLSYVVSFLAVAFFPLALAGYGGHLATVALTEAKQKRRALWIVWGLASAGVLLAALQQIEAYRSDRDHEAKQAVLQTKLDVSLQRQEYMRGQLDSISVMVGRAGERTTDPVLGQLAGTIVKMAENARMSNSPAANAPADARLQITYENSELDGRTISVAADNAAPLVIQLSDFQLKNVGGRATGPVTARLFLSQRTNSISNWQATSSEEPKLPFAFYGVVGSVIINPQETWYFPAFSGRITENRAEPVSAKLKVFYGAPKPAEANFVIRKKE